MSLFSAMCTGFASPTVPELVVKAVLNTMVLALLRFNFTTARIVIFVVFILAPFAPHIRASITGMSPFIIFMTQHAIYPQVAYSTLKGRESLLIIMAFAASYVFAFNDPRNPFDGVAPQDLNVLYLNGFIVQFFPILLFMTVEDETKMYLGLFKKLLEGSEAKNREKTVFISRMSHELRTPLHGLLSTASLLRRTDPSAEQGTLLDTIDLCGEVLLNVIFKILDITRIESGDFEQIVSNFSLFDLVTSVGDLLVGLAEKKGIDLNIQFDLMPEGYDVVGDAPHLKEILLNVSHFFLHPSRSQPCLTMSLFNNSFWEMP